MSPDPSALHYSRLDNPQTFNTYAYVTNDPLKYIDAHGLYEEDEGDWFWSAVDEMELMDDESGGGGDGCLVDACVTTMPDPPTETDPGDPSEWTVDGSSCDFDACAVATPDPSTDPYPIRLFGTHWCGPGGAGPTVNDLDVACKAHDGCYDNFGLSVASNFSPFLSSADIHNLYTCNQALCTAASQTNDYGASLVVLYFTEVPINGACGVPRQ